MTEEVEENMTEEVEEEGIFPGITGGVFSDLKKELLESNSVLILLEITLLLILFVLIVIAFKLNRDDRPAFIPGVCASSSTIFLSDELRATSRPVKNPPSVVLVDSLALPVGVEVSMIKSPSFFST